MNNQTNKIIHYDDLSEDQKERLEAQRLANAKRKGRDLLERVICVRFENNLLNKEKWHLLI